jgi:putative flippase GtrA
MIKAINALFRTSLSRFLAVGALGSILNLTVFFILADKLGVNYNIASLIAFVLAVTQNYTINEAWSFSGGAKFAFHGWRYLTYVGGNAVGFILNIGILNAFFLLGPWRYKVLAQAISIVFVTIFNYFWARSVVFSRKRSK